MNRTLTAVIIIILIILVGWWIYAANRAADQGGTVATSTATSTATTTPGTGTTTDSQLRLGENALVISDQPPANRVIVNAVALGRPGFVVIHRNVSGALGPVVGSSSLLPAGQSGLGMITLNTATVNGERYLGALHYDNGDRAFNAATDPTATDPQGRPIIAAFTINQNAQVPTSTIF